MSRSPRIRPTRVARWLGLTAAMAWIAACATGARSRVGAPTPLFDVPLEARLLAMTDQRRVDTVTIDAALAAAHPATRARAALAIGQVKIKARYPALRTLLLDGDTAVAANAAFALGIGKDSGAVLALARAVAGAPDPVAREAAWALGELGEPSRTVLTVALGDRLGDPRRESPLASRAPDVRAMALLALAKLRPVPTSALVPWLTDPNHEVRRAAAYVVGRARVAGAISAVLPLAVDADEEVRQHVARALARTVAGDSLANAARGALTALLRDSSERVRVNAARSAATYADVFKAALLAMLRDTAPNVRIAAAEGMADVLRSDREAWRTAWAADTSLAVRRLLLPGARRVGIDGAGAADVEQRWAMSADWRYRLASLGETNTPVDSQLARRLASDADARVARAARARLGVRDSAARRTRPVSQVRSPREYEAIVRRWIVPGARQPRAIIETDHGSIVVELYAREAPLVAEAFLGLTESGFYRNSVFHRVVPNFVVQDGEGDGTRDANLALRESWTRLRHGRGCLGLATSGPDTGGSQYYLCHSPQPHLDGAYTVFGHVVEGLGVMDRIVQGDRMLRVHVP